MITELNGAPVDAAQLAAQDHAWAEIQQRERRDRERYERAQAAGEALARGRDLAGFREVRTFDGMMWQRGPGQALPEGFPARYRAAVDAAWAAEEAARLALRQAQEQAQQVAGQLATIDELAARVERAKLVAAPTAALRQAEAATEAACFRLGSAYAVYEKAAATIAEAPAIRRQIEQEHARRLQEIDQRALMARQELVRLQ